MDFVPTCVWALIGTAVILYIFVAGFKMTSKKNKDGSKNSSNSNNASSGEKKD